MKTVAIIPARRNSVRIPGKNWKAFHGKPIIQYSIETAQRSRLFDQIIVSTDGEEIAEAARAAGAQVAYRANDDGARGTQDVAAEVLRGPWCDNTSIACVIYPTAPMMTEWDLLRAWQALHVHGVTYVRAGDEMCNDIGWYYFGHVMSFLSGAELNNKWDTSVLKVREDRAIDINTPEDWAKAEQMYAAWNAK